MKIASNLEMINDTIITNRIAFELVNMILNRTEISLPLNQTLEIFLETSTLHLNHFLRRKSLIQKS
jgi:hypothetical protein